MSSSQEDSYPLDQFDFDWEALNDFDHNLDLFPVTSDTPEFDTTKSPVAVEEESYSRKHKRAQERSEDLQGEYGAPDEAAEVAKAMRHGNFGRIIAESVVASGASSTIAAKANRPYVSNVDSAEHSAHRKDVVVKFMRCLNFSDMSSLAKLIRENCHERVMFMSPEIRDPIYGKADMMILFSLMMEAYPDGVWKIVSTDNEEDKVACRFSFRGTKVFPYPLETVLKQIKAHMNKEAYMNNSPAMASIQLVQDIAERVHPTVAERFLDPPTVAAATTEAAVAAPIAQVASEAPRHRQHHLPERLHEATGSTLPRPNAPIIRPTKLLEATVLKEGLVTYRRQTDFIFDEYDQIVRVIAADLL